MKKTYEWKSALSELIQSYIAEKQMCGFKFIVQERELKHFDEYYFQMGYNGIRLTKPMVNNYIYDSVFDRKSTYYAKERVLHDFGEFLCSHGHKSYIVPIKSRSLKRSTHTPYIFSKEELKRFFVAIDTYPYTSFTNRNRIDPVLFRLLYGAGLRISEALNIQCRDVDFTSGTLTIRHAKNNKDRLVPVSKSLNNRFNGFYQDIHKFSDDNTYFFISPQGGRMDVSTAYCRFRDYLVKAGISHTDSGPRMHDLRNPHINKIRTFL